MDGGIVDPVPAERALQDGCDRLIVVLTRERSYIKQEEKALELAALRYHHYPAFAAALRNGQRPTMKTARRCLNWNGRAGRF